MRFNLETSRLQPFLKWPGGKRWLARSHFHYIPKSYDRYFEPFLGSGALYFSAMPRTAFLSDINADLIATYEGIRENPEAVERTLRYHAGRHSFDHYYRTRDRRPRGIAARAARLIYLNRTCFNGIYRLNKDGAFNVPKGNRDSVIFEHDNFAAISGLLKQAKIKCCDFEHAISTASVNDFIFADPPYTVRHNKNGFIKYNETLFSWSDQVRLADSLCNALKRGAKVLCTNADHSSVINLYRPRGFKTIPVTRFSGISADPDRRRGYTEILIASPNLLSS